MIDTLLSLSKMHSGSTSNSTSPLVTRDPLKSDDEWQFARNALSFQAFERPVCSILNDVVKHGCHPIGLALHSKHQPKWV